LKEKVEEAGPHPGKLFTNRSSDVSPSRRKIEGDINFQRMAR
jgi:hypothetical protein